MSTCITALMDQGSSSTFQRQNKSSFKSWRLTVLASIGWQSASVKVGARTLPVFDVPKTSLHNLGLRLRHE
jgi:hypothetical protein